MAINEERSYTEYNVEVPTTDFPIGFDILDDGIDVVVVTLNDVDPTTLGYTVVQVNNTTYRFAPAVSSGVVRLTRTTDIDQMAHVFTEGAIFISENMDGNFKQIRHSQQEVRDSFGKLALEVDAAIVVSNNAAELALEASTIANSASGLATQASNDVIDTNTIVQTSEEVNVTLSDGSVVPNMNKRIADYGNKVLSVNGEVGAVSITDTDIPSGAYQKQSDINMYGGRKYDMPVGGYQPNAKVLLENGDIVKSTVANNIINPNEDMTGWVKTNDASQIFDESGLSQQEINNGVESIAALRLLNPPKKGERVYLVSVNLGQNEGGGVFVSTQKAGLVDTGGTVIASANPLIFWVRINYTDVTFEMFGAKGDDPAFDSFDAIQRCVNSVKSAVMAGKWYYTSEGIDIPDNFKSLTGVSEDVTRIIKTTNNTRAVDGGALIDYTLYTRPMVVGDPNTYHKHFSGFEIRKIDSLFLAPASYGFYANRLALSTFKGMRIVKFETGIHAKDCWMTTWERVTVQAGKYGWNLQTGTSNVMTACWVISPTDTAYIFNNMLYSVINGCGCDFAGAEGAPANAIISATFSQLTITGMGYEKSHLYKFLYSNGSRVSLINVRGLSNENKYSTGRAAWIEAENSSNIVVDGGTFGLKYKKGDQPNVPNALFLGNGSAYDDRRSDLFKTYSISTGISIFDSNAFFETNGYRREIIKDPLSTDKVVMSDRRYLSNNGLSYSQEPNDIQYNGSYHINSAQPMGFMMMQHINHSSQAGFAFQFGAPAGESNCKNVKMRIKNAGVWSTPCTVRNTDNTTVDANGFVKVASPIVKLFSDHIEANDEVDLATSFEKLGVGDYLIKNTGGFSSEGWYVELPQDANGNKLFAVDYKQLENGDISVKTYKKMFDVETASIVGDLNSPVDINSGRWIDIRLN